MGRRVKIIYTEASGRPPLYTVEENIPAQDKFFRDIIKEIELVGDEPVKAAPKFVAPPAPVMPPAVADYLPPVHLLPPTTPLEFNDHTKLPPIPPQQSPFAPISDEQIFAALLLKGKTQAEIADFLKPKQYVLKPAPVQEVVKKTRTKKSAKKIQEA
jgi:hypothetical protein